MFNIFTTTLNAPIKMKVEAGHFDNIAEGFFITFLLSPCEIIKPDS